MDRADPSRSDIIVINPGSTSTRLARFRPASGTLTEISTANVATEPNEDLRADLEARLARLIEFVDTGAQVSPAIIAARGGMVKPVVAGSYEVSSPMIEDLMSCRYGRHASNLGAPLADRLARRYGCGAMIADPVGVDEFPAVARVSGWKGIERRSFSHALNLRACARRAARELGIAFEDSRFIGVHLGGGVSVAAIVGGRIIDVNNSNEAGPFTPQRTGGLPVLQLVELCFSGEFANAEELERALISRGGLRSYLGTDRVESVLERIDRGDAEAALIFDAMCYQIAKETGAAAAVLEGRVDAVILTGGFARKPVVEALNPRIGWIGRILVYPGEGEMIALAEAAARVLSGEERLRGY